MSTRLTRYIPDDQQRLTLLRLVHAEASKAGLRPDLVIALIHAENDYKLKDGRRGISRYTDIWLARGGRWLCIAAHITAYRAASELSADVAEMQGGAVATEPTSGSRGRTFPQRLSADVVQTQPNGGCRPGADD